MERWRCKECGELLFSGNPDYPKICRNCRGLVYPPNKVLQRRKKVLRRLKWPRQGWYGCEKGQALLEFALVLPITILILLGTITFGLIFWELNKMQTAANAAAQAASMEATQAAAEVTAIELVELNGYDSPEITFSGSLVKVVVEEDAVILGPLPIDATTLRAQAVYRMVD